MRLTRLSQPITLNPVKNVKVKVKSKNLKRESLSLLKMQRNAVKSVQEAPPEIKITGPPQGAYQEKNPPEVAGKAAHHIESHERGLYQGIIDINKETADNHPENIEDPPIVKHPAKEPQPPLPAPPTTKPIKEN